MDVPRSSRGRPWRRIAVGLAACVVLAASVAAVTQTEPAAVRVERDKVWTATVERGSMVREVRAQGRLVPQHVRWVTVLSPGRIERRAVEAGDEVAPGATLFELRNPQLRLELAQARAAVASAQAQALSSRQAHTQASLAKANEIASRSADHRVAQQTARAVDGLGDRGLVPELERSEALVRRDALGEQVELDRDELASLQKGYRKRSQAERRQVDQLEALVDLHRQQLDALVVRTPVAGIVQDIDVHEGQWVVPGDVLAKVADPTALKAVLEVPGSQARDVGVGQRATIELATTEVEGRVARVAPSVQEGFVRVEVLLEGPLPSGARPELVVHGAIELERIPDALYVERPANAAANGQSPVFVLDADTGTATSRLVDFGRLSAKTIEILGGAREGDEIVVSDMTKYAAHERVELR